MPTRSTPTADSPATASIVQTSPGAYKLVLSGKNTGATNAFTITNSLTGGTPPALTDTTQTAINAAFTVNGLAVTSASNTVSDVVAGVTLSLTKKDPATTVTVKVERDTDKSKALINKFISAYNDLQTFAKDQTTAAMAGKASIGRDPLLRGLREALRSASMDEYTGGSMTRLAEIGVGFDQAGKMVLDSEVFDDAMAASSAATCRPWFPARRATAARSAHSATLVEDYTKAGGLVGEHPAAHRHAGQRDRPPARYDGVGAGAPEGRRSSASTWRPTSR